MKCVNLLEENQSVQVTIKNSPIFGSLFNNHFDPGAILSDFVIMLHTPTIEDFELLNQPQKQQELLGLIRNREIAIDSIACKGARQNLHETQKLCDTWLALLDRIERAAQ